MLLREIRGQVGQRRIFEKGIERKRRRATQEAQAHMLQSTWISSCVLPFADSCAPSLSPFLSPLLASVIQSLGTVSGFSPPSPSTPPHAFKSARRPGRGRSDSRAIRAARDSQPGPSHRPWPSTQPGRPGRPARGRRAALETASLAAPPPARCEPRSPAVATARVAVSLSRLRQRRRRQLQPRQQQRQQQQQQQQKQQRSQCVWLRLRGSLPPATAAAAARPVQRPRPATPGRAAAVQANKRPRSSLQRPRRPRHRH
jgi:hypothetical protein